MSSFCEVSGKVKFDSSHEALKSITSRGRYKSKLYNYLCPHCNKYHITKAWRNS